MIFNGCAAIIHLKLEGKTGEINFFFHCEFHKIRLVKLSYLLRLECLSKYRSLYRLIFFRKSSSMRKIVKKKHR